MVEPDRLPAGGAPPADHLLAYGPGPERVVEVRLPRAPGPHPMVVVLHGGFWRAAFDRAHVAPLCADLAARGYLTCAVEYHRIGHAEGGWPGTFTDVAAALDALPGLVAGLAETTGTVLLGHSAGGHLALWAAARRRLPAGAPGWSDRPVLPDGVVALAPVADLAAASRLGLSDGVVHDLLGGPPATRPDRYAAADPVRLLPSGVPTVVLHGVRDAIVPPEVSRGFAAAAGASVVLREVQDAGHFALIDPTARAWADVLAAIAELAR